MRPKGGIASFRMRKPCFSLSEETRRLASTRKPSGRGWEPPFPAEWAFEPIAFTRSSWHAEKAQTPTRRFGQRTSLATGASVEWDARERLPPGSDQRGQAPGGGSSVGSHPLPEHTRQSSVARTEQPNALKGLRRHHDLVVLRNKRGGHGETRRGTIEVIDTTPR